MKQLIVTLEDGSLTYNLLKAIEMLKGVVRVSPYEGKEEDTAAAASSSAYSPRIQRLRGAAKNITPQQIEEDDRLSYLLSK